MLPFHLSIYALSIGALLMALCVIASSRSNLYKAPMAAFLSVYVLILVCDWLLIAPAVPLKLWWLSLMMGLSFLVAPCALLLALQIAGQPIRLRKLEEGMILIGWCLLLPLASSGYLMPEASGAVARVYGFFIHSCMLLAALVFLLQCYAAIKRCAQLIETRDAQNNRLYAQATDRNIGALRILLAAVLSYAAICFVRVAYCAVFDETTLVNFMIAVLQAIIAFTISSAIILQLGARAQAEETLRTQLFDADEESQTKKAKYQNSGLDQQRIQAVEQKIVRALDQDKAYLDCELSLSRLCELIEEPPHTVSQVISQTELQSFYHMVNIRRLSDAKLALVSTPDLGVLQIAFDCGFNSKSAFNAYFKKQTGLTPSQYRRSGLSVDPISYSS